MALVLAQEFGAFVVYRHLLALPVNGRDRYLYQGHGRKGHYYGAQVLGQVVPALADLG